MYTYPSLETTLALHLNFTPVYNYSLINLSPTLILRKFVWGFLRILRLGGYVTVGMHHPIVSTLSGLGMRHLKTLGLALIQTYKICTNVILNILCSIVSDKV